MTPRSRWKSRLASAVRSPALVREAFNASGALLLLSVSGFHVAAVYRAGFFLLCFLSKLVRFRLLGRVSGGPRPSKLAAIGALAILMGYLCVVTLDGLADLVDPNLASTRNGVPLPARPESAWLSDALTPTSAGSTVLRELV
jgi:hypothetical protein